jgi:hypothetical protein
VDLLESRQVLFYNVFICHYYFRVKKVIKAKEKKEIEVRWVYLAFPW